MPWSLLAVPFLIAMNAFFVAAEYALVAIRGHQIEGLRLGGKIRSATAMARLKADPAGAIGAIQVCITMTNLLLGYIGEPAMSQVLRKVFAPLTDFMPAVVFEAISFGLSFIIVTLLTVVFSELLPKALTLRYVPPVVVLTAVPVSWILRGTKPLVWLMNSMANLVTRPLGLGRVDEMEKEWHTAEDIRLITSEAARHGALTARERSLIFNSLGLGGRTARQIALPRMRVAYLDVQKSMDENRRVMNEYLYSRLPLCNGGLDNVIGVVHTKEFLSAYHAEADSSVLSLIAQPAVYAPENTPLDKLLALFHERQTQLVFLVDEYGGVEGIVTLKDVVDELLAHSPAISKKAEDKSEGAGEAEKLPAAEPMDIAGDTPLHELVERLGQDGWGADERVVTIGGLIAARIGRVPISGEKIEVDGVQMHIIESDGRAVRRVNIFPPRRIG